MYSTNTRVERTFIEFKLSGFRVEDISVLLSCEGDSRELAIKDDTTALTAPVTNSALAFATLSWLIGMGAPALVTGDSIIAVGPMAEALEHGNEDGRPSELSEALVNLGIRERDARYCERRVRDGGALVSVRPDNAESTMLALRLFETTGAEQVWSTDEVSSCIEPFSASETQTSSPQRALHHSGSNERVIVR
jgi:hypothetical protein